MSRSARFPAAFAILFVLVWTFLLPTRLAPPPSSTFADDAGAYHATAVNIVQSGFYSEDGLRPHLQHEPGYSLFLAFLYLLFGEGNRAAIFIAQGALYLFSVLLFLRAFRRFSSERATVFCGFLFLLFPSVYHAVFAVNREALALPLGLLFSAAFLELLRRRSWILAWGAGAALGALILTYIPLLFLPVLILCVAVFLRLSPKFLLALLGIPLLFILLWGARNARYGEPRVALSNRSVWTWTMRADRAERMGWREPLQCLAAEYVTRTWTERLRDVCEGLLLSPERWWPDGLPERGAELHTLERGAQAAILRRLPNYLWQSVIEAIEYHLPYVNGWGFAYNVLEAASVVLLSFGCLLYLLSLRRAWRREDALFAAVLLYGAAVFALTNGIPRFRIPFLFAYAAFAAVGYDCLLRRIFRQSGADAP